MSGNDQIKTFLWRGLKIRLSPGGIFASIASRLKIESCLESFLRELSDVISIHITHIYLNNFLKSKFYAEFHNFVNFFYIVLFCFFFFVCSCVNGGKSKVKFFIKFLLDWINFLFCSFSDSWFSSSSFVSSLVIWEQILWGKTFCNSLHERVGRSAKPFFRSFTTFHFGSLVSRFEKHRAREAAQEEQQSWRGILEFSRFSVESEAIQTQSRNFLRVMNMKTILDSFKLKTGNYPFQKFPRRFRSPPSNSLLSRGK